MEIMAVYCISFIMSCLLACCFIAILLHSRTVLVCKLYIFTLICNRYDIKINEFVSHSPTGIVPSSLQVINQDETGILPNAY